MTARSGESHDGLRSQSNQASRRQGSGAPKPRDHPVKNGYVQKSIRKRKRPDPISPVIDMVVARRLCDRLQTDKLKHEFLSLLTKAHTGPEKAQIRGLVRQGRILWVKHGAEHFEREMAKCIRKATDKRRTDDIYVRLTKSFLDMKVEDADADADRASSSMSLIQPIEDIDMVDVPESAEDNMDTNWMSEA
ncbi:uncharacterized protein N0V89_010386 [Didymosphaeria variabile]|uniref:Uncharacterized protein n=1 Tax=Didymosphaeria variabile TaxID=1932322 RepID=A0A9W8XCS5_9PLEO|nr:uncharacterized protein N0V89_010386 [Didymosphaeria variabile]KAJ4346457.1 hypothetical protein N0V89_010386 [Didymosphaeria variabile]